MFKLLRIVIYVVFIPLSLIVAVIGSFFAMLAKGFSMMLLGMNIIVHAMGGDPLIKDDNS